MKTNIHTLEDYRNAPSGIGPLAAEWDDKPHRVVYDMCDHIRELRDENERLRNELIRLKSVVGEVDNDLIDEALSATSGESEGKSND